MGLPAVLAAAGAGFSAIGAMRTASANASYANYQAQVAANNAVIANQNAAYATKAGEASAYDVGLKNRQGTGGAVAGAAAQGLDVNTGSVAQVRRGNEEMALTAVERTRQQAALEAYGYQSEATNFGAESQLYAAQAPQEQAAGFLSAGGTLLSGLSQLSLKFAPFTQPTTNSMMT